MTGAEAAPDRPAPVTDVAPVSPAPVAEVPPAAPAPPPGVAVPSDPPAAAEPPLPGLATLSAGERAALPPLRLSMHVYSDDPARRFVIVDGKRLTEGATPAPGVVVETIRRDGAVLAVNGRRVLLSRP